MAKERVIICADCKYAVVCYSNRAIRCAGCAKIKEKELKKKYVLENKEKVLQTKAKTREKMRLSGKTKTWKQRNRSKLVADARKRKIQKFQATPKWADNKYIEDLYSNCREAESVFARVGLTKKFHVDHIVPLRGKSVCGLHCEDNLQILLDSDNLSKKNLFQG